MVMSYRIRVFSVVLVRDADVHFVSRFAAPVRVQSKDMFAHVLVVSSSGLVVRTSKYGRK